MRFILVSPKNRTAYNFRGDLIKRIISCGYEVIVTGPNRVGVEKIEALGARFVEIPMNKNGVNPKEDLKYQKAIEPYITGFDVYPRTTSGFSFLNSS